MVSASRVKHTRLSQLFPSCKYLTFAKPVPMLLCWFRFVQGKLLHFRCSKSIICRSNAWIQKKSVWCYKCSGFSLLTSTMKSISNIFYKIKHTHTLKRWGGKEGRKHSKVNYPKDSSSDWQGKLGREQGKMELGIRRKSSRLNISSRLISRHKSTVALHFCTIKKFPIPL